MLEKQYQFFNLVHVIYERTLNFKSIFFKFPEFFQDIFIFSQDFSRPGNLFFQFPSFSGCMGTLYYYECLSMF